MDQVADYRKQAPRAQTCLSRLKGAALPPRLEDIETQFLEVIQNDLGDAKAWISPLKRLLRRDCQLTQAVTQRLLGRYYENRSRHRLAIKWTRRALICFQALNHQQGIGQCARLLFSAYAHLGKYLPARAQADAMLALPDLADEERLKITINLGALAYRQHDYQASQRHYFSARSQLEAHANPLLQAIVIYNLGNLQVVFNQFGSAEKSFAEAQNAFLDLGQNLYQAHTRQAFGQLYVILNQYDQAESHLMDAKRTYNRLADPFGAMLCDLEVIRMDLGLNHHNKVLNAMPELLREFQAYGRSAELGQLCYYGAIAAAAIDEPELAEMYLADAESIFRKIGDLFFCALCQIVRSPWLANTNQTKAAFSLIQKARTYFQNNQQAGHELACLLLAWQLDEHAFGEREYRRLRHLLKKPLSPRAVVEGHILLSDYWHRRRQFKRGLRALYTAVNTIEESRASIPVSRLRRSFFEDKAEIFERLLARLLEWGRNNKLTFRVLQLSRSRQMSELLSRREALPPVISRREPTILALQKLDLLINRLNDRLDGFTRLGQPPPQIQKKLLADINSKRDERLRLRKQLHREDHLGLFFPLDIKPEAILNLLLENQLVVIFIRDKNKIFRMELGCDQLRTYQVCLAHDFDKKLKRMIQILRFPIMSKMDQVPQLAQDLSLPFMPHRKKEIRHYIFILHKSLHAFPLALLRHGNRYLIESHHISQCPNIAALYFTLKRGRPNLENPVFFLSENEEDPRAAERHILKKAFPQAVTYSDFRQPQTQKNVTESGFIHFAGHCHFNQNRPSRSFLQLNDQRIYLSQIGRWRLESAPFVNFAACQSGQTAHDAGNEPFGFVVSTIGAGAASVLASLWEVDDLATSAWMTAFYAHLPGGLAHAYRQACITMMKTNPQACFWGGFALVGRADFAT